VAEPQNPGDLNAAFGPNDWLVDELYESYLKDRNSVDRAWWEFFSTYRPADNGGTPSSNGAPPAPAPAKAPTASAPPPAPAKAPTASAPPPAPAPAKAPTASVPAPAAAAPAAPATSAPPTPAPAAAAPAPATAAPTARAADAAKHAAPKTAPKPREALNSPAAESTQGPEMTSRAPPSASPTRAPSAPCTRAAPHARPGRHRRRRRARLPGGSSQGPTQHAPRPLGVSKVHHDHQHLRPPHHPGRRERPVPQAVHELLLGDDGFYDDVFRSLGVPVRAGAVACHRRQPVDREDAMLHKQMQVATLIRVHRVRGHLIADLDPLRIPQPRCTPELDPATYGLTIWDLDREFLTGGVGGGRKHEARRPPHVLRDAYCRTSASSTCTSSIAEQKRGSRARSRAPRPSSTRPSSAASSSGSTPPRRSRSSSPPSTWAEALRSRRRRVAIPILDAILDAAADDGLEPRRAGHGPPRPPQRARQHRWARATTRSSRSSRATSTPSSVQGSGDVKYHLGADGHVHGRQRRHHPSSSPPTRATSRRSTRSCEGMVRAKQDNIDPPAAFFPCCRCSSTATPRSPARAWSPRRLAMSTSRATASAAPST
jgi:hypothetical protein